MTRLGGVASKHSMLDVINGVVIPRNVIIEWLLFAATHELRESLEYATFRLCLVALRDHLEEHMHVHALVDVKEESHSFRWVQLRKVYLLQLADSFDKSLVLSAFDRDFDVKNLIAFFVC